MWTLLQWHISFSCSMHIITNSGPYIESWRNTTTCASHRRYCITILSKFNNFCLYLLTNFIIKMFDGIMKWYLLFPTAERHANAVKTRSGCQSELRVMVPHRPMVAAYVGFMVTRHCHGRARCSRNKVISFVTCRCFSAILQYLQCVSNGSLRVLHRNIPVCLCSHAYI